MGQDDVSMLQSNNFFKQMTTEKPTVAQVLPEFDKNLNYFDKYWSLYLKNEHLMTTIQTESIQRDDLLQQILGIESFYLQNLDKFHSERYQSGRKKHNRRCANEIARSYLCPYD